MLGFFLNMGMTIPKYRSLKIPQEQGVGKQLPVWLELWDPDVFKADVSLAEAFEEGGTFRP